MRKKKTFRVSDLKDEVNRRNRQSTCGADVRKGWNALLEEILGRTNTYNGFCYLTRDKVPRDHLPGIVDNPTGEKRIHSFPDITRVHYH